MHIFKDPALYERAFIRRDFDNASNYEMLEFLGDKVIVLSPLYVTNSKPFIL